MLAKRGAPMSSLAGNWERHESPRHIQEVTYCAFNRLSSCYSQAMLLWWDLPLKITALSLVTSNTHFLIKSVLDMCF